LILDEKLQGAVSHFSISIRIFDSGLVLRGTTLLFWRVYVFNKAGIRQRSGRYSLC